MTEGLKICSCWIVVLLIFRIERRGRPQQAQNTCLKPDGKMMQDEVLKED